MPFKLSATIAMVALWMIAPAEAQHLVLSVGTILIGLLPAPEDPETDKKKRRREPPGED